MENFQPIDKLKILLMLIILALASFAAGGYVAMAYAANAVPGASN